MISKKGHNDIKNEGLMRMNIPSLIIKEQKEHPEMVADLEYEELPYNDIEPDEPVTIHFGTLEEVYKTIKEIQKTQVNLLYLYHISVSHNPLWPIAEWHGPYGFIDEYDVTADEWLDEIEKI